MTLPASSEANLLEFLQLRSLRRPQSFSQFQLSHRPRLGGSPFLCQGRARESQAHLGKNFKICAIGTTAAPLLPENGEGVKKRPPEMVALLFALTKTLTDTTHPTKQDGDERFLPGFV